MKENIMSEVTSRALDQAVNKVPLGGPINATVNSLINVTSDNLAKSLLQNSP